MKEFFKKKWVKRLIIILVIICVFMAMGHFAKAPVSYRTALVERGDVTVTVSGTGTISAVESRKEIAQTTARVEAIYFKEGDTVKKGDVIVKLDSSDYEATLDSQKSSVQQAEISQNNVNRQLRELKITAPQDGFIGNLNIAEGSYVVTNTKICDITIPNKYEITLQFLASDTNKIEVGNSASIFLTDSFSYIDGTVTYAGTEKKVLANGSNVVDVIITVENTDYVLGGLKANATITTSSGAKLTSAEDGYFTSAKSTQVLSGSTGTVKAVLLKDGSQVKKGDVIAELENIDLTTSAQSSSVSLQNMQNQLEYSQSKLEDYAISATIDGVITSQTVKVGDWVTAGSLVTTVSNMEEFEFLIPVDELDISKLKLDSKVTVTLDALPETIDNPIVGRITKLPLEGVAVGGVTDYYVTIAVPYIEGLRIAMNASADIVVQESLDALKVPVECVSKEDGKYYVEVLNGEETEKREVTVGIKNASFYEIVSGLTEGEEVVVPQQMFSLFS